MLIDSTIQYAKVSLNQTLSGLSKTPEYAHFALKPICLRVLIGTQLTKNKIDRETGENQGRVISEVDFSTTE
jgi:hypothetical protein